MAIELTYGIGAGPGVIFYNNPYICAAVSYFAHAHEFRHVSYCGTLNVPARSQDAASMEFPWCLEGGSAGCWKEFCEKVKPIFLVLGAGAITFGINGICMILFWLFGVSIVGFWFMFGSWV